MITIFIVVRVEVKSVFGLFQLRLDAHLNVARLQDQRHDLGNERGHLRLKNLADLGEVIDGRLFELTVGICLLKAFQAEPSELLEGLLREIDCSAGLREITRAHQSLALDRLVLQRRRILNGVEEGLEQGVTCRDNVVLRGDNDRAQCRQGHVLDLTVLIWSVEVGHAYFEALLQVRLYLILFHVRREFAEGEDCFLSIRGFLL